MDFLVLGPLEVRSGRDVLRLGGPKPRAVLADLLVHVGSVLATDSLIDDLWGAEAPPSASAIVQNAVSRLRGELGSSAIETVAPGYVLATDPGSVDAHRFERLVRDAQPLPAEERVVALRSALALWRGPAYMDLAFESFLQGEIRRLDELRLTALEDRLEAEIELGLHERVVSELETLAGREPTRERLLRLQMLALHRSGRTQDALDAYAHARRVLDEVSGLEPGAETNALQLMILRHDPSIGATGPVAREPRTSRRTVALLIAQVEIDSAIDLEAAASMMDATRNALEAAVIRHGGGVAQSVGAELVACFGADEVHEDDVVRAGRAAIEAREILRERATVRWAVGNGRLLVTDGAPMLLGAPLDEARLTLAQAPAGKVVVTPSAARADGGAFRFGSARGSRELVSVRPGRGPSTQTASPLVGREDELARLEEAFGDVVAQEAPNHVIVVGDAGLGKTRLVREFVGGIAAVVLRATCLPYGDGITFLPLHELADQASSIDVAAPSIGDPATAEQAFEGARALLEHFLRSGPVVVTLDDLHWAVPTFLDLVEYVVQACHGQLLVISVARPELLSSRPSWGDRVLHLEPLSSTDTMRLVAEASASSELPDDVLGEIVVTAGGFPLFAEHLVAYARETSEEGGSIPPSLDAVLTSRLDRLASGEREVIERAAVLGVRFEHAVLATLEGERQPELEGRLHSLERAGLLRAGPDGVLSFGHALVRDAAYGGIAKAERLRLHEDAARAFDRRDGHEGYAAAAHLEIAAHLAREVGSPRPPLEHEVGHRLSAAGLRQWRGGDAAGAVNLLGRAVSMLPASDVLRLEVLVEFGLALRATGNHDEAVAVLEEARETARQTRRRRMELRAECEQIIPGLSSAGWTGRDADVVLDQAIPVFRRARDDRGLGQALLVRAFLSSIRCRFGESEAAGEQAFQALERAGYSPSRALLVVAAAALHGPTTVVVARDRCRTLRQLASGERLAQASVDLIGAMIEAHGGETDRARDLLSETTHVFDEHGQRVLVLTDCATAAAEIEILAGDGERANAVLEAAAVELASSKEIARAARVDVVRAEAVLMAGNPGRAVEIARRARRRTPAADLHARVTCMRVTGKALVALEPGPAGLRLLRKALVALEGSDALELRSRVLVDLAHAERVCGTEAALIVTLDEASVAASAKGSVPLEGRVAHLRSQVELQAAPDARASGATIS